MALAKQKVDFERDQTLVINLNNGECAIEGNDDNQLLRATSDMMQFYFQVPVRLKLSFEPSGEKIEEKRVRLLEVCQCHLEEETSVTVNGWEVKRIPWSDEALVSIHLM